MKTTKNPTIATILADFYVGVVTRMSQELGRVHVCVLDELRYYLESEPDVPITDDQTALRYFELQFNHTDAFSTVMGARELLLSMPGFLRYVHRQGAADRLDTITVLTHLKQYLVAQQLLDLTDPLVGFVLREFPALMRGRQSMAG